MIYYHGNKPIVWLILTFNEKKKNTQKSEHEFLEIPMWNRVYGCMVNLSCKLACTFICKQPQLNMTAKKLWPV